ncbi:MAG: hypothetical protein CMA79_01205 [Euryarchaeota archaeon]|nr:hypothetical protein [Euryarchaeota archaeon]|tara:strand:+ start:15961 stop:17433 length:1473 start_codon:yes stop_codon:yes gene_type:complete
MGVAKSDSLLPNPYGDDSSFGQVTESALSRRVRIRDSQRVLWTRVSTLPTISRLRTLVSVVAICYTIVLFSDRSHAFEQVGVALFALQSILFAPALFASSFAQMSARDRLQLKAEGMKSMEAYPGVERILNTLHERVLRERTRILCSIVAALAINSADNFETGTILASFLFGLALFLGAIALLNTIQLESRIPMTDSDFPLLSLHAPTLHQSTLDRVLSDLVVAHLDPETAGAWDDWVGELENKVRSSQTPSSAVEHLLRVLHLNHLDLLDDERLLSESKRVFRVAAIDELTDDNSKFSIRTLRRLMAHTRAWQPGLFRLIDRLQDSAMRGHSSLIESPWRMDLDIPPRCSQGQGDLFVMVHNHSRKESKVEIEIIAADGEPHKQTIRLSPPLSRQPKGPARLGEEGNDLVDVLGRLIDNCYVLWIGLAWQKNTSGSRPVQVTLRGPNGETLSSLVVTTSLSSGFNPEGAAEKMLDAAVAVRRLAISVAE